MNSYELSDEEVAVNIASHKLSMSREDFLMLPEDEQAEAVSDALESMRDSNQKAVITRKAAEAAFPNLFPKNHHAQNLSEDEEIALTKKVMSNYSDEQLDHLDVVVKWQSTLMPLISLLAVEKSLEILEADAEQVLKSYLEEDDRTPEQVEAFESGIQATVENFKDFVKFLKR